MNEREEIKKLIEEGKIKEIYAKNFGDENTNISLEIYRCSFCGKEFMLLEIDIPGKTKTNIRKLIYDIKAHLHKHV